MHRVSRTADMFLVKQMHTTVARKAACGKIDAIPVQYESRSA